MTSGPPHESSRPGRAGYFLALAAFAGLCLAMFGDLIFQSDGTVISYRLADGSQYFTRIRAFGFRELANGNLPLWNPYVFSGTPFVGGFQSAMFYPPNLIYLVWPVATAMNIDVAFHVMLTGFFMFAWARNRGLRWESSFLAGVLLAFGGACFSRVMAGHITMLQALAWAPLVLLSIDNIFRRPSAGWVLIGVFATTMQILAGHPQSLFMTGVLAGLYCMLKLIYAQHRLRVIAALIPFGILPPLIAIVQLWTGLDVATETMRSIGVDYEFASTFSFHPENLITLFMPAFFGNMVHTMYWGRWAFWDSTVFMGIAGLLLAGYGALRGPKETKRFLVGLVFVFLLLSMGRYTPVYRWIYDFLPVFGSFRSPSKFMYPASMLMAMLAAIGFDTFLTRERKSTAAHWIPGVAGAICLGIAAWIWFAVASSNLDFVARLIDYRKDLDDTYFFWMSDLEISDAYYREVASVIYYGLLAAGATALAISAILAVSARYKKARYALLALALVEVFVFARIHRATFNLEEHKRPLFDYVHANDSGDYRIMDVAGIDNSRRNYALDVGRRVIWGYDPVILDRYAAFVVFAAGRRTHDPELTASALWGSDPVAEAIHWHENYTFTKDGVQGDLELFKLLRARYIIISPGVWDEPSSLWPLEGALERFNIMNQYKVCKDREAVFAALADPDFEPHKLALVEQELDPKPATLTLGQSVTAKIVILDESTDHITIDIELDKAALLVITDSYSKNWRATALQGSVQNHYDLIPVDYTLRGIPIQAGKHKIRIEYVPASYQIGRWISLAATLAYCIAAAIVLIRKRRSSPQSTTSPDDRTPLHANDESN